MPDLNPDVTTTPNFDPGRVAIASGWLVYDVGYHTCGGYGPESWYAHEPGCGAEPMCEVADIPDLLAAAAERDAVAADADKWQRAALTLQRDRDALTDERDSLSWQVEALRAERDARSSERDALAAKVERVRALPAKHPAGGWYMTSMRDVLAALDEEPQS